MWLCGKVWSTLQVFVCGSYPHWLMVTQRGALNLHPMFIDGPITSFTAFHNINCPRGFLYFSAEVGGLDVCCPHPFLSTCMCVCMGFVHVFVCTGVSVCMLCCGMVCLSKGVG